jgi:hypothetical protein
MVELPSFLHEKQVVNINDLHGRAKEQSFTWENIRDDLTNFGRSLRMGRFGQYYQNKLL